MKRRNGWVSLTLFAALLVGPSSAFAAPAVAGGETATRSELAQKRAAVEGASADAMAILSALKSDPKLGAELASNPGKAEALLRAKGATHAEHITVTPGEGGAEKTTITISITIDHVTITITIKL